MEMVMKDRRRSWRNISTKKTKIGIIMGTMTPEVMEDKEGKIHFDNNVREIGLILLSNEKYHQVAIP